MDLLTLLLSGSMEASPTTPVLMSNSSFLEIFMAEEETIFSYSSIISTFLKISSSVCSTIAYEDIELLVGSEVALACPLMEVLLFLAPKELLKFRPPALESAPY